MAPAKRRPAPPPAAADPGSSCRRPLSSANPPLARQAHVTPPTSRQPPGAVTCRATEAGGRSSRPEDAETLPGPRRTRRRRERAGPRRKGGLPGARGGNIRAPRQSGAGPGEGAGLAPGAEPGGPGGGAGAVTARQAAARRRPAARRSVSPGGAAASESGPPGTGF